MTDSILQDLRAVREQHAAELGYDLERIFTDLKVRQSRHAAEGWIIIPPPHIPPSTPNSDVCNVRFFK